MSDVLTWGMYVMFMIAMFSLAVYLAAMVYEGWIDQYIGEHSAYGFRMAGLAGMVLSGAADVVFVLAVVLI
jgi:hypothetical protein